MEANGSGTTSASSKEVAQRSRSTDKNHLAAFQLSGYKNIDI